MTTREMAADIRAVVVDELESLANVFGDAKRHARTRMETSENDGLFSLRASSYYEAMAWAHLTILNRLEELKGVPTPEDAFVDLNFGGSYEESA